MITVQEFKASCGRTLVIDDAEVKGLIDQLQSLEISDECVQDVLAELHIFIAALRLQRTWAEYNKGNELREARDRRIRWKAMSTGLTQEMQGIKQHSPKDFLRLKDHAKEELTHLERGAKHHKYWTKRRVDQRVRTLRNLAERLKEALSEATECPDLSGRYNFRGLLTYADIIVSGLHSSQSQAQHQSSMRRESLVKMIDLLCPYERHPWKLLSEFVYVASAGTIDLSAEALRKEAALAKVRPRKQSRA